MTTLRILLATFLLAALTALEIEMPLLEPKPESTHSSGFGKGHERQDRCYKNRTGDSVCPGGKDSIQKRYFFNNKTGHCERYYYRVCAPHTPSINQTHDNSFMKHGDCFLACWPQANQVKPR